MTTDTTSNRLVGSRVPVRHLMGPGPSDVSTRVLSALARPTIGHLDPEFVRLMDETQARLRAVFRAAGAYAIPISGPGSAAMEVCFFNAVEPGDVVVVCENGVFGARMREVAIRAGAKVVSVVSDWGTPVSAFAVEETLKRHPEAKVLAFVHAETSTGVRSDAEALCKLAKRFGCITLVDAVTSVGGIAVEFDAWGIDLAYAGSQKCLSVPPGISPVVVSQAMLSRLTERKQAPPSWFMDLALLRGYWGTGKRAYHHTAPVNMLYALHEGLGLVLEEGLEAVWGRHRRLHEALVAGFTALGLELPIPPEHRLPQLNIVRVPDGADDALIRARLLEEDGLEIGAGLGPSAGKLWRIGLMGHGARWDNVFRAVEGLGRMVAPTRVEGALARLTRLRSEETS